MNKTLDPKFKYEIAEYPGGEYINRCFACGTCTLSCPVSEVEEEYSPRKIIHMILMGMKEEILNSKLIWYCQSCYRCYVRCPQDVRFPELMRVLRKIAVEEGYVKPEFLAAIKQTEKEAQAMRREELTKLLQENKRENRQGS